MKKISELIKENLNRDLILYVLFGVGTTIVNYVVFFVMARLTHAQEGSTAYLWINVIAWIAAVLFAYITNKLFVFHSRGLTVREQFREFLAFTAARLASLGLEEAGIFIFITCLKYNATVVKLLLQIAVVIINYFLSKYWIFRQKKAEPSEAE